MSKPQRIQRKRTKCWRMPENCVYVGRPSIWGNPFKGENAVENYIECISEYPLTQKNIDLWVGAGGKHINLYLISNSKALNKLSNLRGKNLACWCPLDKPCHADILLQIANEKDNLQIGASDGSQYADNPVLRPAT